MYIYRYQKPWLVFGIVCGVLWVVFLLSYTWYVSSVYLRSEESLLRTFGARIKDYLRYADGKWDTTYYASDPLTPHPTGSSGFTTPLYIITIDGFVIERNQPVSGLLDTSDFSRLISFNTPQSITTITNEHWRVFSLPIISAGERKGVIFVSSYRPHPLALSDIDRRLVENASRLLQQIDVYEKDFSTDRVDTKTVDYDISYEIVDAFNIVRMNNGRTPSYVDVSYVSKILLSKEIQHMTDTRSNEEFLIHTTPYRDSSGETVGVIVVGQPLAPLNDLLRHTNGHAILWGIVGVGVFFILSFLIVPSVKEKKEPLRISFDKKQSIIYIDDQQVSIPYATNQYYLCEAVFSSPKKRWELDELLDRFGEESSREQWRKVYDAMMVINKKISFYLSEKLILHQEKTYRFNPHYLSLLS